MRKLPGRLHHTAYTTKDMEIKDPNGMPLEFTLDARNAARIARDRKADARATLRRWLGGDHRSNNMYR